MAYVKVTPPSVVYHLTRMENLDSILDDGKISRFMDSECWFCESLGKMKAYMEQTVMCEGKPYMNRLDQLSRDELIQAADEISAMMTCHSELMAFGENLSRKKMIFLLQQEKPLELLSEAWMEHQTVDVGETFQSLLTGLYDETRQTQVRDVVYAIQPKTIEELLTSYPDDYFQLMTPCGFVDLTPSETEKLLHGEATMAHPGVSGCQMPVEAQELLEMEVLSLKRDEHGCWYALTDHPQQKMEQAPQEPQML